MTDPEKIEIMTALLKKLSRMVGFFMKKEIQEVLNLVDKNQIGKIDELP